MRLDSKRRERKYLGLLTLSLAMATPCFADDPCANSNATSQVAQQCKAAKASESAAKKNEALAVVHVGVAAVCTWACVTESASMGMSAAAVEQICNYSAIGATVADAVATKDFMGGMMGIMGSQMIKSTPAAAVKDASGNIISGGQGTTTMFGKTFNTACLTAGFEGVQGMMKKSAADDENSKANEARSNALSLTPAPLSGGLALGSATTGQNAAAGTGSIGSGTALGGGQKLNSTGDQAISSASSCDGTGYLAKTSCALASDSNIPGFVQDPKFMAALQKATGMNLDDFANKVGSEGPAKTLGDVMGAAAGGGNAVETANALTAATQRRLSGGVEGTAYAGGGAPRGSGGDGEDPMAKAMQDMLAQFGPKKPGDGTQPGVNELAFGSNARRYPASVAEDRKVSLFDRVTSRYQFVAQRVLANSPAAPASH